MVDLPGRPATDLRAAMEELRTDCRRRFRKRQPRSTQTKPSVTSCLHAFMRA